MIQVKFTKDYATQKKGDVKSYDSQLSCYLINTAKVAKVYNKKEK